VPPTIIVLAAGFSRRFGSPKQLHLVDGEPLVRRAARIAREAGNTIVVIPPNAQAIRDALQNVDVTIVENADAAEGMASSIRAGVRACEGNVLITLCDQPNITADHLRALATTDAPIAATAYANTLGVPAFFSLRFRNDLLALRGDSGAKAIVESHRNEIAVIKLESAAEDIDILDAREE
jgi:molybdenum cofactor cytidylyltransferase